MELTEKVNRFKGYFEKHSIDRTTETFVCVSDHLTLIPLIFALDKQGLNFWIIKPAACASDLQNLVSAGTSFCVITDSKSCENFSGGGVIWIDEMLVDQNYSAEDDLASTPIQWKYFDPNGCDQKPLLITAESIAHYYQQLDNTVGHPRRLLLSTCVAFEQLIIEALWACARGISCIIADLEDQETVNKHMFSPKKLQMDFSLFYFGSYAGREQDGMYDLLFSTAKFADDHDFSAVWTPERHFNKFGGLYPNPSVISAALAVQTKTLQIRSGSLVSPLHHTLRIAEDWSVVDNISNGRVAISFASGWQCDDFVFFPENYKDRHELMLQQIQTVRQLWQGQKAHYKNGLDHEVAVEIYPKPVQKELPVWVTVSGKIETFIDAGKIGANILTHLLWQNTDELIEKIVAYRNSLKESGFDPRYKIVSVMAHTFLGEDTEVVRAQVSESLKKYILSSTQLIQSMAVSVAGNPEAKATGGRYGNVITEIPAELLEELTEIAFNRFFEQAGLLGSVDKAAKLVQKLKSYDVDEIACLIDFGLDKEKIEASLQHLNELRKMYRYNENDYSPVDTVRCSALSMEKTSFHSFLNTQTTILTDLIEVHRIPSDLLNKVKMVVKEISNGVLAFSVRSGTNSSQESQPSFNALIDDQF